LYLSSPLHPSASTRLSQWQTVVWERRSHLHIYQERPVLLTGTILPVYPTGLNCTGCLNGELGGLPSHRCLPFPRWAQGQSTPLAGSVGYISCGLNVYCILLPLLQFFSRIRYTLLNQALDATHQHFIAMRSISLSVILLALVLAVFAAAANPIHARGRNKLADRGGHSIIPS